jgi:hypothetical protein
MVMDIPTELIATFPTPAEVFLDRARRNIDDTMLMEIARPDYGSMADKMMDALRTIRDDMSDAAARFLTWRIPHMQGPFERLLSGIGWNEISSPMQ